MPTCHKKEHSNIIIHVNLEKGYVIFQASILSANIKLKNLYIAEWVYNEHIAQRCRFYRASPGVGALKWNLRSFEEIIFTTYRHSNNTSSVMSLAYLRSLSFIVTQYEACTARLLPHGPLVGYDVGDMYCFYQHYTHILQECSLWFTWWASTTHRDTWVLAHTSHWILRSLPLTFSRILYSICKEKYVLENVTFYSMKGRLTGPSRLRSFDTLF